MAAPIIAALISTLGPYIMNQFTGGSNQQQNQMQGNPWSGYPTQQTGFYNNFSPQRQQGVNNWLSGLQNSGLQNNAFNSLNEMQQPFNADQYNDFFNQGVVNPTLRNLNEDIIPSILSWGGSRGADNNSAINQAIGRATEESTKGLGALRAQYLNQGRENHMNRQLQATAQSLGLFQNAYGGNDVGPLIQEGQPGGLQEFIKSLFSGVGGIAAQNFNTSQWFGQGNNQNPKNNNMGFLDSASSFGGKNNPTDYLRSIIGQRY